MRLSIILFLLPLSMFGQSDTVSDLLDEQQRLANEISTMKVELKDMNKRVQDIQLHLDMAARNKISSRGFFLAAGLVSLLAMGAKEPAVFYIVTGACSVAGVGFDLAAWHHIRLAGGKVNPNGRGS